MNPIDNDKLLQLFKAIAENSRTVIGVKDVDGRYIYVNAEYSRLFHIEQEKFIGKTDFEIFPQAIASRFREADLLAQKSTEAIAIEEEAPVNDEIRRYLSLKFPIRDSQNKLWATGLIATDITEMKRLEGELRLLAGTDMLTGCNNRRRFLELASAEWERAQRYNIPLSILVFDIDYFKQVNDTYGHTVGDSVLQNTVRLCEQSLRKQDILGRIGGEEFCIAMPHTTLDDAVWVGKRIQDQLAQSPVYGDGERSLYITLSIGIAELGPSLNTIEKIIMAADGALYRAKKENRNCIRVYQESAYISNSSSFASNAGPKSE